ARGEQLSKFFANFHQLREVLHIFPGIRILDHCDRRRPLGGRRNFSVHLAIRLFYECRNLANLRFCFHRSPSSPLISDALRPPTRACTRAPVVITKASKISSAPRASFNPTSIASK